MLCLHEEYRILYKSSDMHLKVFGNEELYLLVHVKISPLHVCVGLESDLNLLNCFCRHPTQVNSLNMLKGSAAVILM